MAAARPRCGQESEAVQMEKRKLLFEVPTFEVVRFDRADVITASGDCEADGICDDCEWGPIH